VRECPTCRRVFHADEQVCPDDGAALVQEGEADPLIGSMAGSYRIVRRLARGGMGTIYAGEHPTIGSSVAIKVLHAKYAADPAVVQRFFNEARAVNLIGHENIVYIFDLSTLPDGRPYLAMELLRGRPLSVLCGSPHGPEEIIPIFLQIASALGAAHAAGIVHRDLKPDNVFLVDTARGPQVRVLDFGIAKLAPELSVQHTDTGAVLGSARYLSPEQAAGEGERVGPPSDVYSMGVMLFELLSGRLPFGATTYADLLLAHRTQAAAYLREVVPSTPEWLENVVARCLAKDPSARFQRMAHLAAALTPGQVSGAQSVELVRRRRERSRYAWLSTAVIVLGPVVLFMLYYLSKPLPKRNAPWVSTPPAVEAQKPVEKADTVASAAPAPPPQPVSAPAVQPEPTLVPQVRPAPASTAAQEPTRRQAVPRPKVSEARLAEPHYEVPEKVGDGFVEVKW
jgi:serine/threonine-protein kinase